MVDFDERNRYSFKRKLGEQVDIPKNQFGQSIISEQELQSQEQIDVSMHPKHGLQGNVSILHSAPKVLENMMNALPEDDPQRQVIAEQIEALRLQSEEEVNKAIENKQFIAEQTEYVRLLTEEIAKGTEESAVEEQPTKTLFVLPEHYSDMDLIDRHESFLQNILDIDENCDDEASGVLLTRLGDIQSEKLTNKKVFRGTKLCSDKKICSKCKSEVPSNAKFCVECGNSLVVKFCSQCAYQFSDLDKFCPECGTQR